MNGKLSRIRNTSLLLALVLVGCGSNDGTAPPVITITLTPSTLALFVGETSQLVATASGASGLTVQFESSNTTVATVDQTGLVTAQDAGTAVITASVAGHSGVEATAQVTVTGPEIELRSIQQNGADVDLSQISGVVEVTVDHELGPAPQGVIELLVDGEVVVSVEIAQPSSLLPGLASSERIPGSTTMEWNTADVNDALVPRWENGDREIGARFTSVTGLEYEALPIQGRSSNRDGFFLPLFDADQKLADPRGFDWVKGQLLMEGRFVAYGDEVPDPPDGMATLLLQGQGGLPDLTVGAEYTNRDVDFTVPAETTDGLEGELFALTVTVDPTSGGPPVDVPVLNNPEIFPDGWDGTVWIDAAPPTDEGFVYAEDTPPWHNGLESPRKWSIGVGFRFDDDEGQNTVTDGGSGAPAAQLGGVDCDFHGGDDPDIQPKLGFSWEPLTASQTPIYFFQAHCFDPFGNGYFKFLVDLDGNPVLFGLDFIDPVASLAEGAGLVTDRAVNPADPTAFAWTATDNASGVDRFNWRVGFRFDAAGVSPADGCLEGLFNAEDESCEPVPFTPDPPGADPIFPVRNDLVRTGYNYSLVVPTDNAGNEGEPKEAVILNDPDPPVIVEVSRPGTWNGGEAVDVRATLQDNVDLFGASSRYVSAVGGSYRWNTSLVHRRTPWDDAPVGSAEVTVGTDFFINSVQETFPFTGVPTGFGSKVKDHILEAFDAAGNFTSDELDISANVGGQFTPNLGTVVVSETVEISSLGICVSPAILCPTELTFTITVVQNGLDADPVLTIFIPVAKYDGLLIPQSAGATAASALADEDVWQSLEEFVTSQTTTSENDAGTTIHTTEIVISGAGMPLGQYESRILGVNADGNALASQSHFFRARPGA